MSPLLELSRGDGTQPKETEVGARLFTPNHLSPSSPGQPGPTAPQLPVRSSEMLLDPEERHDGYLTHLQALRLNGRERCPGSFLHSFLSDT